MLVFFFSATIYSCLPKSVLKAARTKDGTAIKKNTTKNRIKYSKILNMLSLSLLYIKEFDLLLNISNNIYEIVPKIVIIVNKYSTD